MTLVFTFPGQSSRYPGMLAKLVGLEPTSRQVLAHASELLGRDLAAHYDQPADAAFGCNRDVQIGVFLANHLFLRILSERGIEAEMSLGLSLGEYNHLVHIGALGFEQALLTVQARGEAYDAGPRGMMASVFPISVDELAQVVEQAADGEVLEIVNLNSPRQQVLSGTHGAVERALGILEVEHFVEAVVIEREVPMHSSLFQPVAERFRLHLESLAFAEPALPYLPNRTGRIEPRPDFVELLASHVHMPVLWRASIEHVLALRPGALLLEVGAKAVLTNLLDRKWQPGVRKAAMDSTEDTAGHLERLLGELGSYQEHSDAAR